MKTHPIRWLSDLLAKPYPSSQSKDEAEKLLAEWIRIGKRDDCLSDRHLPGAKHLHARQIERRLHHICGMQLVFYG